MITRKLIAYGLITVMIVAFTGWAWVRQRRARLEKERRHGPRAD